jgi:glycosyltransferase involved in cell wall biosynthesis
MDGIGRFADETLRIITTQHPEHQFYFYFDRKYDKSFIYNSNVTPIILHPQARHPFLFLAWFEASLPFQLARLKPDVFLSPDGFLSLSSKVKSVAVIHDLNFEHYPGDIPFFMREYYTSMFPRFARKAARIATVSEYSKNDIAEKYQVEVAKIDVVYNGASRMFKPVSKTEKQLIKAKYSQGNDYFLFIGTLHPRKNLVNLFRAFDQFKQSDNKGIKLLLAGARMWWTGEISASYEGMKHKDDVIFTGRISDQELASITASALALTYVSYFEGFGIPILEAFQCDTPVITSNVTSMPEVAGDAALLVNPFSTDSISDAMKQIASDSELREKLILKARDQRQKFSWDSSAEKLWNCIEKAVDKNDE